MRCELKYNMMHGVVIARGRQIFYFFAMQKTAVPI